MDFFSQGFFFSGDPDIKHTFFGRGYIGNRFFWEIYIREHFLEKGACARILGGEQRTLDKDSIPTLTYQEDFPSNTHEPRIWKG